MSEIIVQLIRNRYGKVCGIVYPLSTKWIAFQKHSKMSMSSEHTAIKWIGATSNGESITEKDLESIPDDIRKAVLKKVTL